MAISRSSPSSEPPAWLEDVYERRRRRTLRLVELSMAALVGKGESASLAAIARTSKTVDPAEPHGVSESAILHNEQAYALYRQHTDRKRRPARARSTNDRFEIGNGRPIRVTANRDSGRA